MFSKRDKSITWRSMNGEVNIINERTRYTFKEDVITISGCEIQQIIIKKVKIIQKVLEGNYASIKDDCKTIRTRKELPQPLDKE